MTGAEHSSNSTLIYKKKRDGILYNPRKRMKNIDLYKKSTRKESTLALRKISESQREAEQKADAVSEKKEVGGDGGGGKGGY